MNVISCNGYIYIYINLLQLITSFASQIKIIVSMGLTKNRSHTHRIFDRCNFLANFCETTEKVFLKENIVGHCCFVGLVR